jgi:membrane associated rhomboid family serine protease
MGIYDRDYNREHTGGLYGRQMRLALPPITPVVMRLLIINVAVFVAAWMIPQLAQILTEWFSVYPWKFYNVLQVWRLVTYQFLHDGIYHILINMLVLYFFGPMLERQWGSRKFLTFYLVCGAMGGILFQLLVIVHILPAIPIVGASGAIYGMLAAGAILFPNLRIYLFGIFPMPFMVLAIIFAGISILRFFGGYNAGGEAAHLAGMAAGAVYVLYRPWRQKLRSNSQRTTWLSKINQQRVFQAEVDRILDKINISGIASLTKKEKKMLKEASQRQQNEKY